MDGHRARVYSRIRENKLNPRESDVTRTERQQAVIQALLAKLTGLGVLAKLPFIGDDVMKPLTTDLTAGQMMQLALVKKRSGNELHCRLGGTPTGLRRRLPPAGRGGPADDRGVPRPLGAAAAPAGVDVRLGLPVEGPGDPLLALDHLLDVLVLLSPFRPCRPCRRTIRSTCRRRGRACASPGRSRSSRTRSP